MPSDVDKLAGPAEALRQYRLRDLWLPPSLLSLLKIPLAIAFPWVVDRPLVAIAVLTVAGVSDVLDGWLARRYGWVTATGCAIDPITDKLFVLVVVVTLIVRGILEPWAFFLLSTREIGELPLVAWLLKSHAARRRRSEHPKANWAGKVATVLQFVTVAWALLQLRYVELGLAATAIAGAFSAFSYSRREWRASR
jgi:CDP-diacylglycerol--glycerol-3-phosphate 3-phosphatidyltransferase